MPNVNVKPMMEIAKEKMMMVKDKAVAVVNDTMNKLDVDFHLRSESSSLSSSSSSASSSSSSSSSPPPPWYHRMMNLNDSRPRYSNPYDLGCLRNSYSFCLVKLDDEWTTPLLDCDDDDA